MGEASKVTNFWRDHQTLAKVVGWGMISGTLIGVFYMLLFQAADIAKAFHP